LKTRTNRDTLTEFKSVDIMTYITYSYTLGSSSKV